MSYVGQKTDCKKSQFVRPPVTVARISIQGYREISHLSEDINKENIDGLYPVEEAALGKSKENSSSIPPISVYRSLGI